MQSIVDFSRFSPEVLRAIEISARMAAGFNSNIVMPCHLVGGLASVNGEEVCSVLQNKGFDSNSSMEAIAQGMSEVQLIPDGDGVSFHPELDEVFAKATLQSNPVTISVIMNELLATEDNLIGNYLIRELNPNSIDTPISGVGRNYQDDDSSTGDTIKHFCVNMLELAAGGKFTHA